VLVAVLAPANSLVSLPKMISLADVAVSHNTECGIDMLITKLC
jgi:hypothetical protein